MCLKVNLGIFCKDQGRIAPKALHIMAVWFIEEIHHCVGEIQPLKQEFGVLS